MMRICWKVCWLPTIPFWSVVFALFAWWLALPDETRCVTQGWDAQQEVIVLDQDAGGEDGIMLTIPDSETMDLTPQPSKQEQFISWLLPMIGEENKKIATKRQELVKLYSLSQRGNLTLKQKEWLSTLALEYEVELGPKKAFDVTFWQNMLHRVDIIPPSLVLTQAALESGWGTSRVAKRANNYFGLMCFKPHCGLASAGVKGDYRKFRNPQASVYAYMHLINTRSAYRMARTLRIESRLLGNVPSGYDMAKTLHHYSELGSGYIMLVLRVMQTNHFEDYDGADLVSIEVLSDDSFR
jgi:Bax protein